LRIEAIATILNLGETSLVFDALSIQTQRRLGYIKPHTLLCCTWPAISSHHFLLESPYDPEKPGPQNNHAAYEKRGHGEILNLFRSHITARRLAFDFMLKSTSVNSFATGYLKSHSQLSTDLWRQGANSDDIWPPCNDRVKSWTDTAPSSELLTSLGYDVIIITSKYYIRGH
jgi:hypothetical protein